MVAAVPIFTLTIRGGTDGQQDVETHDFPNERAALRRAETLLSAEHRSVAVGRGEGGDVEFLGVWTRAKASRAGRRRCRRKGGGWKVS